MYDAHIRADGVVQSVSEHLRATAQRCAEFAAAFGQAQRGYLLGSSHDIGKYSQAFQKRLHGGPIVDHATAGARECEKIGELAAALCVIGHHSGLPDLGNWKDTPGSATFWGRINKKDIPAYSWNGTLRGGFPLPVFHNHVSEAQWLRMLYSCLVDADYLDTEAFMTGTQRPQYPTMPELLRRLEQYIQPWFPAKSALNAYRCEVLRQCMDAASAPQGVFSLAVPTGGGKTVASLAFALRHAVQHGMARVIYVIPYTSIIEQNAKVFREILGDEVVIEHHCGVQAAAGEAQTEAARRQQLASENWDAPVIVTTAVQFFESLYANSPSKCRKLHNIANSVVIFDEAQMIPTCHLKPCVAAIANLVTHFRATAVLCTATQPSLEDLLQAFSPGMQVREICPQTRENDEVLRRVQYEMAGELDHEALAGRLNRLAQVLCIVNTRKAAQEVFAQLAEEGRFHLSTLLYPAHRSRIMKTIRERLRQGLVCRVVSTSLIQAGVDLDFPAVYREMCGLDSIVQAAGRCNREGKRCAQDSVATIFESEQAVPSAMSIAVAAAKQALQAGADPGAPETMRMFFRELRSLTGEGLDKCGVVAAFEEGIGGCDLPFRTVAERFRLIEDNAYTVYVPDGDEAEECIRQLRAGACTRALYRKLGQYAITVYDKQFKALKGAGALWTQREVAGLDDRSAILCDMALYDERMGLAVSPKGGEAFFV